MLTHESHTTFATFHVAELAHRTGVTPATVRYYARIGLLSSDREPENGYRCFHTDDVYRIEFIRQAQSLGLKICDVKVILESVGLGNAPCDQVKSLVESRLNDIKGQIGELQSKQVRMIKALKDWDGLKGPDLVTGRICPLIEQATIRTPIQTV